MLDNNNPNFLILGLIDHLNRTDDQFPMDVKDINKYSEEIMTNLGNNLPSTNYENSESLILFQTPEQKSHLLNSLTDGDLRSQAANNEMVLETKKTMVKYVLRKELCNAIERNNDLKSKMEVNELENLPTKRSKIEDQIGHIGNTSSENLKNKIELSDLSETSSITSGTSLSELDKKFDTLQQRLIKNVKLFRQSDMYINNFIIDRYFLQEVPNLPKLICIHPKLHLEYFQGFFFSPL